MTKSNLRSSKYHAVALGVFMIARYKKVAFSIMIVLLICGSSSASEGDVRRHLQSLKKISDLVDTNDFDGALDEIRYQKEKLIANDYIDNLYLVYFNNKEGYAYYRLGDMCRSEAAYRASKSGAGENMKINDEVLAQNYIALGRIYIEMNDREKEDYLSLEISKFTNKSINVSWETMFSLVRVLITIHVDLGDIGRAERLIDGFSTSLIPKVVKNKIEGDSLLNLFLAAIQQGKKNNEDARRLYEIAFKNLGVFDDDESKKFPVELANYARLLRSLGDEKGYADAVRRAEAATRRSKRDAEKAVSGIVGRSRNLGVPGLLCDGRS